MVDYEMVKKLFRDFLKKVRREGDISKLVKYEYRTETTIFTIFPVMISELKSCCGAYVADAILLLKAEDQKKLVSAEIRVSDTIKVYVYLDSKYVVSFEVDEAKLREGGE